MVLFINETVLEMHFHRPLMELFQTTFGRGSQGNINFYKYSPQREVFIGFDQAYVMTELSDEDFFNQLKSDAMFQQYQLTTRFIGYFLQYKVVKKLTRRSKNTPQVIASIPHFRIPLDTHRNANTSFSQHELLRKLSKNDGAMVYYACPMIFEKLDLLDCYPDLDSKLRLADMSFCPSDYTDNDSHYIYFDQPMSDPVWCSEPVFGKAVLPTIFVQSALSRARAIDGAQSLESIRTIVKRMQKTDPSEQREAEMFAGDLFELSESFFIVRIIEER